MQQQPSTGPAPGTMPFYQPRDGNPGMLPNHQYTMAPSSGRASLGGTHYL